MLCAEILLSGLLYVSNKSIDIDTNKDIYIENGKSVYVIPDKNSLVENVCENERYAEGIDKTKMKAYMKTLE